MARGRANRGTPRPPARRGGASYTRALWTQPPVNGFTSGITSPSNGASSNDRTPTIYVTGTSQATPTVDFEIEWRRQEASFATGQWLPLPTYTVTVPGATPGVATPVVPPTDLAYGSWWYRVRAGRLDTNTWGAWSPQQWIDIRPVLGSMTQYVEMNVGVTDPPLAGTIAYVEMNIGLKTAPIPQDLVAYAEMNVGVVVLPYIAAVYSDLNIGPRFDPYVVAEYMDIEVVAGETPVPHIWWIRPEQGREGYVFNIYGQGFGAFQNEYDGKVLLGNLVCSIARWELVPAQNVQSAVNVLGRPRSTTSTTTIPWVALVADTVTIEAGDIIEYDMRWDVPGGSRLDIFPYFTQANAVMGYGTNLLLNDTTGDPWISDQPEAYEDWHHRTFIVPSGHYLVGKPITNFGVGWYGFDGATPLRGGSIRSFVIRQADGTPKLWLTGDDNVAAPSLTYTANGGALQSATFEQEGYEIIQGAGLDPDTITPEHGWIVAVVPSGAVSSMVRVVLEDD